MEAARRRARWVTAVKMAIPLAAVVAELVVVSQVVCAGADAKAATVEGAEA